LLKNSKRLGNSGQNGLEVAFVECGEGVLGSSYETIKAKILRH